MKLLRAQSFYSSQYCTMAYVKLHLKKIGASKTALKISCVLYQKLETYSHLFNTAHVSIINLLKHISVFCITGDFQELLIKVYPGHEITALYEAVW